MKVLWFSRHKMTQPQFDALKNKCGSDLEINQVDRTINSAYELTEEIESADVVAIVAPLNLQAQFVKLAGDKPVITAVSERVLTPDPDGGETKAEFVFLRWDRIRKIEVVTELFAE